MIKQIISSNCEYYILYRYVYDYELENFKTEFLYYLPYYVSNDDLLKTIDVSVDIDQQMEKRSKKIRRDSTIIPKRPISNDGIYGELFLDFYLRIVKERNLIITYASKKDFAADHRRHHCVPPRRRGSGAPAQFRHGAGAGTASDLL